MLAKGVPGLLIEFANLSLLQPSSVFVLLCLWGMCSFIPSNTLLNGKQRAEGSLTADRSFPGEKGLIFFIASRWSHPQKLPQKFTSVTQNFPDKWKQREAKHNLSMCLILDTMKIPASWKNPLKEELVKSRWKEKTKIDGDCLIQETFVYYRTKSFTFKLEGDDFSRSNSISIVFSTYDIYENRRK